MVAAPSTVFNSSVVLSNVLTIDCQLEAELPELTKTARPGLLPFSVSSAINWAVPSEPSRNPMPVPRLQLITTGLLTLAA